MSVCLSLYYVFLSVCLSVYVSVCLCVRLSMCLSVYVFVCPTVFTSVCPSGCVSAYVSVCSYVRPSVCLSVCLSVTPGDNLIVVWEVLLVRALCHLLFVWVNICVLIYSLVFMFSCTCERDNSYLYVMYPLLQCTALSSFLNLPTLPLSSCLFSLFFSTALNCPFLYSSSSSSPLLHSSLLSFSLLLFPPLKTSLSTDSIQRQKYCKYSSYSQGFAFYQSIFSDVRYSTFR